MNTNGKFSAQHSALRGQLKCLLLSCVIEDVLLSSMCEVGSELALLSMIKVGLDYGWFSELCLFCSGCKWGLPLVRGQEWDLAQWLRLPSHHVLLRELPQALLLPGRLQDDHREGAEALHALPVQVRTSTVCVEISERCFISRKHTETFDSLLVGFCCPSLDEKQSEFVG